MAILGLLLLAAATALGVETVLSNRGGFTTVEAFDRSYSFTTSEIVLVGAAFGAAVVLGLWMVLGSLTRARRKRNVARHRVRAEDTQTQLTTVGQTAAELAEENDRLRNELAAERRSAATMGGVAVPPGAGDVAYGDQVSDAVRSDTISQTGHFDPYPADRGTDGVVNTEAGRADTRTDTTGSHAGVTGNLRGNP